MSNKNLPAVGSEFHVLSALTFMLTPHQNVTGQRAQSYVVTEEMIAANTDRRGFCWLSIIEDEAAQVERWGSRKVAPGPVPENMFWWDADPASRSLARTLARENAASIKDPVLKMERLAEVDRIYGKVSTSQSIPYIA